MIADDITVNTLLISCCKEYAALLRQSMESDGINGNIHRIDASLDAMVRIRELCRDRSERRPDFILFDCSEPEPAQLDMLRQLAFGSGRSPVPVVVMTSPETETILQSSRFDDGGAVMFSPITLDNLVATLKRKRRSRFLRALSVIYAIGPVLVKAPAALFSRQEESLALTA